MKFITIVPLIGGFLSSMASKDFASAPKPKGQPPSWVFAPVWTVLYLMMGYAASLVWPKIPPIFWVQLALNLIWSPVYTRGYVKESFAIICALWISILMTIQQFPKATRKFFYPYLAWVTYALYLNYNVLQK